MGDSSGSSSLRDAIEERKKARGVSHDPSAKSAEPPTPPPPGVPEPSRVSEPSQRSSPKSDHEARAGGAMAAVDAWGDLDGSEDYSNYGALSGFPEGADAVGKEVSGEAQPAREVATEKPVTARQGSPERPPSKEEVSERAVKTREAADRRAAAERREAEGRAPRKDASSQPKPGRQPQAQQSGARRPSPQAQGRARGAGSGAWFPDSVPVPGIAVAAFAVVSAAVSTPMAAALFVPFAGAAFSGRGWGSVLVPGAVCAILSSMWFFS